MNFKKFTEEIRIALKEKLNREDICIYSETAVKNSHTLLPGLIIEEKGSNILHSIPLKECYDRLKSGDSLSDIADEMADFYNHMHFGNTALLENFDELKGKIIYRLVNQKMNEVFLRSVPYMPFLDLAITFHILLETSEEGIASLAITNYHLNYWGIDAADLFSLAAQNTEQLLPSILKPYEDYIPAESGKAVRFHQALSSLRFLSNQYQCYGASCILYEGLLSNLAEDLNSSFYILPCTVDEIAILPESKDFQPKALRELVQDVVRETVDSEQVLSSHPYYYDRKTKELSCI